MQQLLQWKSNKYYIFSICVCRFRNPARDAPVLYCHLLPIWFYNTFLHYAIEGNIVYILLNVIWIIKFSINF